MKTNSVDCIFCKIAKGDIASHKIYEDKEFLAFLDINPNTKGMTLLIPKKHYNSYIFDMPLAIYKQVMLVTKKIAGLLEKSLQVKRVAMVMEGMGVDHAHIKLYPLYGLQKKFEEKCAEEKIFFEEYQGYITTLLGPRANDEELRKLAQSIRGTK